MSISFSGLASGIDTSQWVDSLTSLKRAKIETLEEKKNSIQSLQETLNSIKTFFSSFRTMLEKVTDTKFGIAQTDLFTQKLATSSNMSVATATVTNEAEEGKYDVTVEKLASNTQATSGFNRIETVSQSVLADFNTKLKDLGIRSGSVEFMDVAGGGGKTLSVSEFETIGNLVDKLNGIGIDAAFDVSTAKFSIGVSVDHINDIGNTGFVNAFNLGSVAGGAILPPGFLNTKTADESTYLALQLGVEDFSFNLYDKNNNLIADHTTILADYSDYNYMTVGNLLDSLRDYGVECSISNGVISIGGGYYIEGALADSLGISKENVYETVTIRTVQSTETLVYEEDVFANALTLLSQLGVDGLDTSSFNIHELSIDNNGNLKDTIIFTNTEDLSGQSLSALSSILSDNGLSMSLVDGVIQLSSSDKSRHIYIEGALADALGISTKTETMTLQNTQTSSSVLDVQSIKLGSLSGLTFAPDGTTAVTAVGTGGNKTLYFTKDDTLYDVYNQLGIKYDKVIINGEQRVLVGSDMDLYQDCDLAKALTSAGILTRVGNANGYVHVKSQFVVSDSKNRMITKDTTIEELMGTGATSYNISIGSESFRVKPMDTIEDMCGYIANYVDDFSWNITNGKLEMFGKVSNIEFETSLGSKLGLGSPSSSSIGFYSQYATLYSPILGSMIEPANDILADLFEDYGLTFAADGTTTVDIVNLDTQKVLSTLSLSKYMTIEETFEAFKAAGVDYTLGSNGVVYFSGDVGINPTSDIVIALGIDVYDKTIGVAATSSARVTKTIWTTATAQTTLAEAIGNTVDTLDPNTIIIDNRDGAINFFYDMGRGVFDGHRGLKIVLGCDIDLQGYTIINQGTSAQYNFSGTFDGMGHTLSNFSLDSNTNCVGLFGNIANATVKNLNLKNVNVTNRVGSGIIGLVASKAISDSKISGVTVDEAHISDVTGTATIGGIVGYADGSIISDSQALQTCSFQGGINVAGIVGKVGFYYPMGTIIDHCKSEAMLRTDASDANLGGIIGLVDAIDTSFTGIKLLEVTNCLHSGTITALSGQKAAGIIGYVKSGLSNSPLSLDIIMNLCVTNNNANKLRYASPEISAAFVNIEQLTNVNIYTNTTNYDAVVSGSAVSNRLVNILAAGADKGLGIRALAQNLPNQFFKDGAYYINGDAIDMGISNEYQYVFRDLSRYVTGFYTIDTKGTDTLETVNAKIYEACAKNSYGGVYSHPLNYNVNGDFVFFDSEMLTYDTSYDVTHNSFLNVMQAHDVGGIIQKQQINVMSNDSKIGDLLKNNPTSYNYITVNYYDKDSHEGDDRFRKTAQIAVNPNSTFQDLIDQLAVYGITADIVRNSGRLTIAPNNDAYIESITTDLENILHLGSLSRTVVRNCSTSTVLGEYMSDSYVSDTKHLITLASFGLNHSADITFSDGAGNSETVTFGPLTRLGDLLNSIHSRGIDFSLINTDPDSFTLKASSFAFIKDIDEDLANILGLDVNNLVNTQTVTASNTSSDTLMVPRERQIGWDTKISDLTNSNSTYKMQIATSGGNVIVDVNSNLTLDQLAGLIDTESYGELRVGITSDGKIEFESMNDDCYIIQMAPSLHSAFKLGDYGITSVETTVNTDSTALGYRTDEKNFAGSLDEVQYDIQIQKEGTGSAANYAGADTALGLLNVSSGSLSVFVDGRKETLQISENDTFEDFQDKLSAAFSDLKIKFDSENLLNEGRLTIYSTAGRKVNIGSTTDTSNLVSVLGLMQNSAGEAESSRKLYRVTGSSVITDSGLFARGNVKEGEFTIGDEVFTIDDKTTLNDLISQINASEKSLATAYWDSVNGNMVIKSRTSGASVINIESGSSDFTDILGFTSKTDAGVKKINMESQKLGSNASFTINGTKYTSNSNTITSDISRIKGLTINLKNVGEGASTTITVEKDKETLANAVSDVVDSYNELMQNLDTELSVDGKLRSETTLKMIRNQLRNMMSSSDIGTTVFRNLDSIGICFDKASVNNISTQNVLNLNFDKTKFMNAYEADWQAVKDLLTGSENNTGIFTKAENLVENALRGVTGYFDSTNRSLQTKINTIDKKIIKGNEAIERYRAQLEKKFSAMDLMISKIQQQYSSFLS